MDGKILVRETRPEDKEAVLSFCRKTWEWGDYIPEVWDKWIKDPSGKIFVGVLNGKPVGITNVVMIKEGEAWLRGARTHPEYRRKGVITAITKKCLEFAAGRGAKKARLVTESTNIPAQKALEKLGFKPVATFLEWENENFEAEASSFSSWAENEDLDKIWLYLQTSECFKKSYGLYTKLFTWISLDKDEIQRFIRSRSCIKAELNGEILGVTLIDNEVSRVWRENSIQICYVDGNLESATDMLKFLNKFCKESGIKKIYAFSCDYQPVVCAFENLGFKRENSIEIVYEKTLD